MAAFPPREDARTGALARVWPFIPPRIARSKISITHAPSSFQQQDEKKYAAQKTVMTPTGISYGWRRSCDRVAHHQEERPAPRGRKKPPVDGSHERTHGMRGR